MKYGFKASVAAAAFLCSANPCMAQADPQSEALGEVSGEEDADDELFVLDDDPDYDDDDIGDTQPVYDPGLVKQPGFMPMVATGTPDDDNPEISNPPPGSPGRGSIGGHSVKGDAVKWQAQLYQPWALSKFRADPRTAEAARTKPLWQLQHLCGGVLISEGWVLTAAHCIANEDSNKGYRIRLGSENIASDDGWTYPIIKVVRYPGYRDPAKGQGPREYYDLALVQYQTMTGFGAGGVMLKNQPNRTDLPPPSQVRPIALDNGAPLADNTPVFATGWGVMENGKATAVLMKVNLFTVEPGRCAQTRGVPRNNTVVCAGGTKVQTCQGDSGGPLVPVNGAARVVGIVSYNNKDCFGDVTVPGVYTRVANPVYLNWIRQVMGR